MSRVISVVNQKGGVAKTTTVVNLAAALSQAGKKTLVIDLDPQANASQALGVAYGRSVDDRPSVYEVLLDSVPLAEAVVQTPIDGLSCVRSDVDLAGSEVELVSAEGRESLILGAIRDFRESKQGATYDFILIDCPPSLGLLTLNALVAADELLVPIPAEFYALDGLVQLIKTVTMVRSALNPELEVDHLVMTMVDESDPAQLKVIDEVRAFFSDDVIVGVVPRDAATSSAPASGQTVVSGSPDSPASVAYRAIAETIVAKGVNNDK